MSQFNRVLITGAAGNIGRLLRRELSGYCPALRLIDVVPPAPAGHGEETMTVDLSDMAAVMAAMKEVDAIIHLGGIPVEAPWANILDSNIVGTYNLYEAARLAGVKRIIFASSNHVTGFCRRERKIDGAEPVRPDTRYGVSKVFGEALGRLYADKHGIETIVLRIGQFRPIPTNRRMLSLWLSPADMVRLARSCLDVAQVHFEVVYGVSANTRAWYQNTGAANIGFTPLDNAEDYAQQILAQNTEEDLAVEREFQGGPFCGEEFDGDIDRID